MTSKISQEVSTVSDVNVQRYCLAYNKYWLGLLQIKRWMIQHQENYY